MITSSQQWHQTHDSKRKNMVNWFSSKVKHLLCKRLCEVDESARNRWGESICKLQTWLKKNRFLETIKNSQNTALKSKINKNYYPQLKNPIENGQKTWRRFIE